MVDFKKLTDKAKDVVEQRGGTQSLREDAEELKNIAKGDGTAAEKLKRAASAIRDPGAGEESAPQSPGDAGSPDPRQG